MTNIKLDDTWRGTNENFLMHYNNQLRLLDSLVDSGEKLPDNARVTFLESAIESVPDVLRVSITANALQAQLGSTRPISYRSYFDLLKEMHLDQATKRGNKIQHTNVHFSGPNDEDAQQDLSSDDNQVIQQENVCSEPPESLSYSRATSKAHSHPPLRRPSFPNLYARSSPKINNKCVLIIIDLCPKMESLISQHPTRVLPLHPTNQPHDRQPNLSKCTPINLMKALLTPPKLRPPLLTLY